MNYAVVYDRLINRARNRKLSCYTEGHHVLPRCLGGDNSPQNIVELTAEEHFVAHKLLVQMHPNDPKVAFGLLAMSRNVGGNRQNNKLFGWARRRVARAIGQMKAGVPRDPEMMKRVHALTRGRKATPEQIAKQKAGLTGVPKSTEHVAKVAAALKGRHDIGMFGRKHTPETIERMRLAALARPKKANPKRPRRKPESERDPGKVAGAHKAWATKRSRGNADTPQTRGATQPTLDV